MTKGKLTTWWKEGGNVSVKAILVMAAVAVVAETVGYAKGYCHTKQKYEYALNKCFDYNPALKDELAETIRAISQV